MALRHSCFVARETVAFGRELGLDIRTTPIRSPESNGMAEAFVKTFKRDYVLFGDLRGAGRVMQQLSEWIEDYNERAPHKALAMRAPIIELGAGLARLGKKQKTCMLVVLFYGGNSKLLVA